MYGTWTALGIVGVAAIGVVVFGEQIDAAAVVGILLIVVGVYGLNAVSDAVAH